MQDQNDRAGEDRAPLPNKLYEGVRYEGGCGVTVNGQALHHVAVHSPTGFEWGYGGSGPADLALSILADHFGERPRTAAYRLDPGRTWYCWSLHNYFLKDFVQHFPRAGWSMTARDIETWLAGNPELVEAIRARIALDEDFALIDALADKAEAGPLTPEEAQTLEAAYQRVKANARSYSA
jgi:hypothetical protein